MTSASYPELSPEDFSCIAGFSNKVAEEAAPFTGSGLDQAELKTAYTAIFNWRTMRYDSVSSSIKNALGYDLLIFVNQGLKFVLELIHPEDREQFRLMHERLFNVFYNSPIEVRTQLKFAYMRCVDLAGQSSVLSQR